MSQPAFDFGDEPLDEAGNPTYSVVELADAVNEQLRRGFFDGVWVRGEIDGWTKSRAGHIYFDLVETDDAGAVVGKLRIVFFAGNQQRARTKLRRAGLKMGPGMRVRIFGYLDFHAPAGNLSLRMVDVDPRFTLGAMAVQRDELLRRLRDSGLAERNRALALPVPALRVGVVTSRGSAAWHDFHDELVRSALGFELRVCDTRVQGTGAEQSVAAAIRTLAGRADVDCIAVIRGGGARNELATFDAEPIAVAIATSEVPVLTGLGHEIDRSVADEVAHTSHKTPTACARALIDAVHEFRHAIDDAQAAIVAMAGHRLTGAASALADRAHRVARRTHAAVERADERLATRRDRLASGASRALDGGARQLDDAAQVRLGLLDPANLLRRGWSISRTADGAVIRGVADVATGDVITTELADGRLTSRIEEP